MAQPGRLCLAGIVTSPPYFGLRRYGDAEGEIGRETTPAEFVAALLEVFAEARRVLKDTGTVFVNIGDGYANDASAGIPRKSLMLVPERFAVAMVDAGWHLRNKVVWEKTNPLPEPVTDRIAEPAAPRAVVMSRAWEPVYLFTKRPSGYCSNADAIREPYSPDYLARWRSKRGNRNAWKLSEAHKGGMAQPCGQRLRGMMATRFANPPHPLGRNARDVWTLAVSNAKGIKHPALMPVRYCLPGCAMPLSLAERCLLAGCPVGGNVLDPFAGGMPARQSLSSGETRSPFGSGCAMTTLLATASNGRNAVGVELDIGHAAEGADRLAKAGFPVGWRLDAREGRRALMA
ncbi:site-specific DNA-methyltransferase [Azospirillum sp. TSO5]|uniref:DNA-methyltransferase n=1 Tax=Azospirillum sp. TSO5 TaxID=716760 RepID=UPI001304917E|nr:site-specific DNA-methyltransferase [Azospirillum sp. TSO5]